MIFIDKHNIHSHSVAEKNYIFYQQTPLCWLFAISVTSVPNDAHMYVYDGINYACTLGS